HFLCDEIINPRFFVDLWELPIVPERVRIPADLYINTKFILEIPLPNKDLPNERLAGRHVEVRLYPHASHDFPTTFLHPFLDFLKKSRILLFHPGVSLGRRHSESEIRILPH